VGVVVRSLASKAEGRRELTALFAGRATPVPMSAEADDDMPAGFSFDGGARTTPVLPGPRPEQAHDKLIGELVSWARPHRT